MVTTAAGLGRLENRRILVTGAASGMGKAIAELFATEGAKLALLDMAGDALRKVAGQVQGFACQADLSSEQEIKHSVAASAQTLGGLDGIVNAAGILVRRPIEETDYATFMKVISVNLAGPFLICREALPHLREAPRATIVNIASLAGFHGLATMGAYSASKGGLVRLSEASRRRPGRPSG